MSRKRPTNIVRRNRLAQAIEALETRTLLSVVQDSSFGSGGKVLADFGVSAGYAMSVLPGGKILVAGSITKQDGGTDFLLARYNADGSLDTTFGDGGKVTTDFGTSADDAYAMTVQSDGKIVLAGHASSEGSFFDFAVARYSPDGSLDSGFGANHDGRVIVDFAGAFDQATGVAVQADGRIVVGGVATVGDDGLFALLRLDAAGGLDHSFGPAHTGKIVTLWSGAYAEASAIATCPSGTIVLAGYAYDYATGQYDAAIARYDGTGALDASFGVDGLAKVDFGQVSDRARSVAVLADGRLLLGGFADDMAGNADFALA